MYPQQNYLICLFMLRGGWNEACRILCHQHHLYVLKWLTEKGFALLQEKEPNTFAFKCSKKKRSAFSHCGTSFWLLASRGEEKKSRHAHPSSPSPTIFYFLLKQMRPIVGNFCAALTASMVTLTEINAFNLPLWCIWDAIRQPLGVPSPICCSVLSCSLASYIGSLWRALARPRKEPGGPCSLKSAPSP